MNLPELQLSEDGRCYIHDGVEYERVTALIHEAMPPYLAPWAEKVGQAGMFEVMREQPSLSLEAARMMIRERALTIEDEKQAGGDRGQALHQAIEAMILSGDPSVNLDDFDDPEHRLYAQSFSAFMVDYQPTFEVAEVRVCHPELGYAGTFDAIATCRARPKGARGLDLTGKRIILDWKTNVSKKVYESHLYQLAAYQLALDHWGEGVDGAAVVAVGPTGKVKGKPDTFKANHVEPEAFRALCQFCQVVREQRANNPLARKK